MARRLLTAVAATALVVAACGGGERAVQVAGGDGGAEPDPAVETSVLPPGTEPDEPGTGRGLPEVLPGQRIPGPPEGWMETYTLLHDGVAGVRPGGAAYLPEAARAVLVQVAATTGKRLLVPAATPAVVRADWGRGLYGSVSWRPKELRGVEIYWGWDAPDGGGSLWWTVGVPAVEMQRQDCDELGSRAGADVVEEVTVRPGVPGCYVELKGEGTHARWLYWVEGGVLYTLECEPRVLTLDELLSVARAETVAFG